MKVSAEELKWSSLWEEKACLDCFITENLPKVGLERLLELSTMSYGSTPVIILVCVRRTSNP